MPIKNKSWIQVEPSTLRTNKRVKELRKKKQREREFILIDAFYIN